jgi:HSP20 family molecular chaperone IbpA
MPAKAHPETMEASERRCAMAALTISGRVPTLPRDALITETDGEYVVHLVVPGFGADDLDVEVADHTVTIRGERTRMDVGEFRLHDRLEEWLELPGDADPDALTASYQSERLELHAPRFRGGCPPARKVAIRRPFALNPDASGV